MKVTAITGVMLVLAVPPSWAQQSGPCRVLCTPEFKVEPSRSRTSSVFLESPPTTARSRETAFEVILSLGLPTRIPWFEFTVEATFLPFDRAATSDLEFEANFVWLPGERTRGWVSSHVDIVDKIQRRREARRSSSVHA